MRLDAPWIYRPETRAVCSALTNAGFQALFVGGCVRNTLLGVAVSDIDIATDALPEDVSQAVRAAGLHCVPTGVAHGTVTVVSDHIPHEVTTFRRDIQTDGRRAVVAFSTDVTEDALRRDFTMNALYATPAGQVIDPLGGIDDLRARQVRFIADAASRIREDYLRILRFFRFHAWYGDAKQGLDPEGLAACAALSDGIETLSKERIGAEMMKLLAAPDPAPSLAAMKASGILARVLAGADAAPVAALVHLEAAERVAPDALRRLAVIGGDNPRQALRLARADANRLDALHAAMTGGEPPAVLGYRLGQEGARDVLFIRSARGGTPPPDRWRADVARGAAAKFPVRAADLMPGLQGPALGARLKQMEDRWIASDFTLDRRGLIK